MEHTMKWTLLLMTSSLLVHLASPLEPEVESKINEFAEKLLTCRDVVGLNIAVVQDDVTVFRNGYGVIDLESQRPVTAQTMFGIASLTKAFTATLLGQVLTDNDYSWSTKVRDVLGEDFYFYDGLRTSQVTMQDLAAHTLGILNHNKARYEGLSRRDAAYKLRFFEPTSPFRASMNYNNAMYGLMAYITEVISGKSWEDTLRDYIFNPASMTSSTFSHFINQSRQDIARPYMVDFDTDKMREVDLQFHSFWGKSGGSGSIMSNTEDMAQWLRLQLAKGKVAGREVISQDVIEVSREPVNRILQTPAMDQYKRPTIPVTYAQTGYGLGWRLGWYRGRYMILHTGTSWGYGALLTLLPDVNIGIYSSITGSDSGYVARRLLHMYVMDLLLGEEPWLDLATACTYPEPWASPDVKAKKQRNQQTDMSHLDLVDYEGTYGNFQYGNITFEVNRTAETLTLYYGDVARWHLVPSEKEHEFSGIGFEIMWAAYIDSIQFSNMEDGHYTKVDIDFEATAPATFERGLRMSDAPPPPDPDDCGTASQSTACSLAMSFYVISFCFAAYFVK